MESREKRSRKTTGYATIFCTGGGPWSSAVASGWSPANESKRVAGAAESLGEV